MKHASSSVLSKHNYESVSPASRLWKLSAVCLLENFINSYMVLISAESSFLSCLHCLRAQNNLLALKRCKALKPRFPSLIPSFSLIPLVRLPRSLLPPLSVSVFLSPVGPASLWEEGGREGECNPEELLLRKSFLLPVIHQIWYLSFNFPQRLTWNSFL